MDCRDVARGISVSTFPTNVLLTIQRILVAKVNLTRAVLPLLGDFEMALDCRRGGVGQL